MNYTELISALEKSLEGSWQLDGSQKHITFHLPEHSGSKGRLQSDNSPGYGDHDELEYQIKWQGGLFHMTTHNKEYSGYREFTITKTDDHFTLQNIETNERLHYSRFKTEA